MQLWFAFDDGATFSQLGVSGQATTPTAAPVSHLTVAAVHQVAPVRSVRVEIFSAQDTGTGACRVYLTSVTD